MLELQAGYSCVIAPALATARVRPVLFLSQMLKGYGDSAFGACWLLFKGKLHSQERVSVSHKKKKKVSIFRDMREGKEEIFISLKE